MFGQGYVGTAQDAVRIRRQEKQREEQKKKYEELQKAQKDKVATAGLRNFGKSTTEVLESTFKSETVGLVTRDEFIQKRVTLQDRLDEQQRQLKEAGEDAALREKEKRRREKGAVKPKLSFVGDEPEEEEAAEVLEAPASPDNKRFRFGKLGKDPNVQTDFLPDKDREREEELLRQQLKKEYAANQAAIRSAPLEITYSYWDGQGHRRKVAIKRGDTVSTFLKAVREQLAPDFRELRATSIDNLMYVKEDVILPHHYTFHDLIVNKARGKSGPLFDFGVTDDIRLVNDATVEKMDSHAGKVVERHWYEKNKHIFPASRWEVYDADKAYDKYTIFG